MSFVSCRKTSLVFSNIVSLQLSQNQKLVQGTNTTYIHSLFSYKKFILSTLSKSRKPWQPIRRKPTGILHFRIESSNWDDYSCHCAHKGWQVFTDCWVQRFEISQASNQYKKLFHQKKLLICYWIRTFATFFFYLLILVLFLHLSFRTTTMAGPIHNSFAWFCLKRWKNLDFFPRWRLQKKRKHRERARDCTVMFSQVAWLSTHVYSNGFSWGRRRGWWLWRWWL